MMEWAAKGAGFSTMPIVSEDNNSPRPAAVVLLSGGLDSATTAAIARAEGYRVFALSVDYGQRHRFELQAADAVARSLGVERHVTVSVGLGQIGGSALTADVAVPKDRSEDAMSHGIPVTYVPARNTVFLSLALGLAEVCGASDLVVGINAVDYSGYPDCRPEFLAAFERLASLATAHGVRGGVCRIHAPLIALTKADIIRKGLELGLDYGLTHSCYDPGPDGRPCNRCDSCVLRAAGFVAAGTPDPLLLR